MSEEKALKDLSSFISYLENTKDSEWQTNRVRSKDNQKNCVMGHLVNWYYGKGYHENISPIWDTFESMWATTYMIYPVNDGESPKWMNESYNQKTPRERCIAYLKNLNPGKEKNTRQLYEEDVKRFTPTQK